MQWLCNRILPSWCHDRTNNNYTWVNQTTRYNSITSADSFSLRCLQEKFFPKQSKLFPNFPSNGWKMYLWSGLMNHVWVDLELVVTKTQTYFSSVLTELFPFPTQCPVCGLRPPRRVSLIPVLDYESVILTSGRDWESVFMCKKLSVKQFYIWASFC